MPRDVSKIIEDLRQPHSAQKRKHAILQFSKALRREHRFQLVWNAVGGASGLASLMAEFSIRDLRELCKRLGMTASAKQARTQRRAALGELVAILYQGREDGRPLDRYYQNIIPACNLEVVQTFEKDPKIEWTLAQGRLVMAGHQEKKETKLLEIIFSADRLLFVQHRSLFRGNIPLAKAILTTLLAKDDRVHCPSVLMEEVIMPFLKRLLKSRFDDETRNQYLHLVLQVIQKHHDEIGGQLDLQREGLVQYIIDRWSLAPNGSESKRQLESYLVQAIKLFPSRTRSRATEFDHLQLGICVSGKLSHGERYTLLRLLLLHLKDHTVDIESCSELDLSRLRQTRDWPSSLFFCMDYKKSLELFEKLDSLFPQRDFLRVERQNDTILSQSLKPIKYSPAGDPEVVHALLIRRSQTQHEHPGWQDHAIDVTKERRTKAQQAREASERAYWAISALNLCQASGDLLVLNETIVWSRRFIKDSAVSARLYSGSVFKTREMEELLGAMPDGNVDSPEAVVAFTSSLMEKDIKLANQSLIEMVNTAAIAVGEPGFEAGNWAWLFGLIKAIVNRRTGKLDVLFKNAAKCTDADGERCQRDLLDTIWKPTTNALIEISAVISNSALEATRWGSQCDDSIKAIYVYQRLANESVPPLLLAELARFLIDQMRARLGSKILRAQMQSVVFAINRLASSDQPSLAAPFIRDVILDEDSNETSSWHRQLLSPKFLSILPAKAAEELLGTMAGAMKEKMREQNQPTERKEAERTKKDITEEAGTSTEKERTGPSIKVTTVKMLAQILQHKVFIDPSSSCEILVGLLSEARHIDIRTTVTDSLFATLEEPSCPPHIRKHILDALEKYVVPVASQLNERCGLDESDWIAASEHDSSLPVIGEDTPLLSLLIEKAHQERLEEGDRSRLAQLVMSALEQSAANNERWVNLFLAKYNFSLEAHERLPKVPAQPVQLSMAFVQLLPYTPISIFQMVKDALFNTIDPSPGIKRITKAIQEDRDLVNSNAGKHWLSQFSSDTMELNRYNIHHVTLHLASTMQKSSEQRETKLAEGGLDQESLQSFIIDSVAQLIETGRSGSVVTHVRKLCESRVKSRENWETWKKDCLPMIKTIIQLTEEAQARPRNREEEPVLFPSVLLMKTIALPLPLADATDEEELKFVQELYEIIGSLSTRQNRPYHTDLHLLKQEIKYWPLTQSNNSLSPSFGRYALKLASVQDYDLKSTKQSSLKDFLCWEIIAHLLSLAEEPSDVTVAEAVRDMMREWNRCDDMAIRMLAKDMSWREQWLKVD
ncbi:hypothetical protein ACLX1H_011157 [Fusarium chlamydosporum]